MSTAATILGHLEGLRTELVSTLEGLVALETPSRDRATHAPAFDFLEHEFRALDLRTRRLSGEASGGQLFARQETRPRRAPVQLMLGHVDTVWPVGTLEQMPVRDDGKELHGPGVFDMKAGLIQMMFALKTIRDLGLSPAVSPLVFINSDEETGSHESTRQIVRLARVADRAFVLEPSLGPDGKIKTARKGVGRFEVTVKGKAAHAGLNPDAGASAILELSHVIQSLFAMNDPARGVSVNVGTIDGGLGANVIAPESKAMVDVRVPTAADAERVQKAIHSLEASVEGTELAITGGMGRPPMEHTPGGRALWENARDAARKLDIDLDEGMAGGGSDGNTTNQFTPTLDGLGAVGGGAHAEHEHVRPEKLIERTALLTLLLLAPPVSVRETREPALQ